MILLSRIIVALIVTTALSSPLQADALYKFRSIEEPIRYVREGDLTYLSIVDLARSTGCQVHWDPLSFQAQLIFGESDLVISMFSNFVTFDDQLLNITYPVLYRNGDLYVPAITFINALDNLVPISLFWDEATMTIWAEESQYNILDLKFKPKMNGYLIEVIVREKLPYEAYVTEQKWININIFGGNLDERHFSTLLRPRAIKRIRAFQFDESAQIAVKFFRTITKFHHSFTTNPSRIQISIVDPTFDPSLLDSLESQPLEHPNPVDVIVIDAGHGGEEDGAMGQRGTKEKDIVLSVAKRVHELLSADSSLTVVMTRTCDTSMTLRERADFANRNGGDLFVSIHTNASSENPRASGSQTFFLASAMNEEARITAELENRSLAIDRDNEDEQPFDDLDFVLLEQLQTEYLDESQELASYLRDEMKNKLKIRSRGVDQAGFYILNEVAMPSALVELAFISNKREEALLKKDSFQQKAAEAICAGIKKFIDKYSALDY
ncbi:MAG: N-acetylmuramoyl-L-alanine amidase [candidate division Zixibacteria bacterium]|nr:N-acetylmuramoyl-L-alanine amidase [candidate division Zixibacteria bacterium]